MPQPRLELNTENGTCREGNYIHFLNNITSLHWPDQLHPFSTDTTSPLSPLCLFADPSLLSFISSIQAFHGQYLNHISCNKARNKTSHFHTAAGTFLFGCWAIRDALGTNVCPHCLKADASSITPRQIAQMQAPGGCVVKMSTGCPIGTDERLATRACWLRPAGES